VSRTDIEPDADTFMSADPNITVNGRIWREGNNDESEGRSTTAYIDLVIKNKVECIWPKVACGSGLN
jgi:hypothetical protein